MRFRAIINDETLDFDLRLSGSNVALEVGKNRKFIDFVKLTPYSYSIIMDGKSHYLTIAEHPAGYNITIDQNAYLVRLKDENELLLGEFGFTESTSDSTGEVRAPIPGLVSSIAVGKGQRIQKGDKLLLLEAMKMENEIDSPMAGTVEEIFISEGQSVEKDALLVKLELDSDGRRQ